MHVMQTEVHDIYYYGADYRTDANTFTLLIPPRVFMPEQCYVQREFGDTKLHM